MTDTDLTLKVPQGTFTLQRLPLRERELLRAWDAADEYLLNHLAEENSLKDQDRILIINDHFGALSVALKGYQRYASGDSLLAQHATRLNLKANDLSENLLTMIGSLDEPEGVFDWVLIKIPKTLALLEDQLIRLRSHINKDTHVIAAGMVKGMPASAWKLMDRIIGPTTPSRAVKKARLIFVQPDESLPVSASPYPTQYTLEHTQYRISNHANVFSREQLDIGTRLFLNHIPASEDTSDIVDLGCGNGVVGVIAAERNPNATLHFTDESFMAVASAKATFEAAFGNQRKAQFYCTNALEGLPARSADTVLCNPPFHQQQATGDQIAVAMFSQSKKVLKTGGVLWVIGNRHLNYDKTLKRWFRSIHVVASDRKFVIIRAS